MNDESVVRRLLHGGSFRRVLLLATDGAVAGGAILLALLLRFEGSIREPYAALLPWFLAALIAARISANTMLGLHRWSFRSSGLPDAARLVLGGLLGTGLFLLLFYLGQAPAPPRSVVVLEFFLSTAGMGLIRFLPRLGTVVLADQRRSTSLESVRTIIVGAGVAGELLLRDLRQSAAHSYSVVGFVDDDASKRGVIVGGKAVLGTIEELPAVARKHDVKMVLIAIPRISAARIRQILALCTDVKLRFRILPVSFAYLSDRLTATMLQDLTPEDLLPRPAVEFSESSDPLPIGGRSVLVTGAAGSIGQEICSQLLDARVRQLVMVDINENEMYLLGRRFENGYPQTVLRLEVADIRDAERMNWLLDRYRPQDVLHAAAHKHVPLMEAAPCEAIKNNVLGTLNVAAAADRAGAERFVLISTDKAVRPTSVMGVSKRVAEMIVRRMARTSRMRCCAVRFGNVLGSAGSVVPLFRAQIAAGGPVTVTDPTVKRYFMTVGEAVDLVLHAAYRDYGELCVLDMGEQIRIVDLARHMITMAGLVPETDIAIEFIGLRPGEKLSEELLTEEEEGCHEVSSKIVVVRCAAPPANLEELLRELAEAASRQDANRVRVLLKQVVPSYEPAVAAVPVEMLGGWATEVGRTNRIM